MSEFEPNPTSNPLPSTSDNALVFVDSAISNYNGLISALSPQAKLITLDSTQDEIAQISEILNQSKNISSVHIFSHGESGELILGETSLNRSTLAQYQEQITGWSKSLTDGADILLYGCNVAEGQDGKAFVQQVSQLTGADVAASDNLTGNPLLGGDWTLEYNTGLVETEAIQANTYNSVLHGDFSEFLETFTTTHTAVRDGSWFDPNTWGGSVPGSEAGVYIPAGRTVTYNGESSARLKTVHVEGTLEFASNVNSSMLVDTIGVSGQLAIGTVANPIQADKTVKITFRSDTMINTAVDTKQFGKGLVSHGQARIYGADKLDHAELQGDALRGSRELLLGETPTGWRVGDQIVVGGTSYNASGSHADNSRFQDEVLTITAINGNRISFTNNNITSGDTAVLRYDHKRPAKYLNDYNLKLYVANTTRNVVFQSEQGATTPIKQRGHVMFMDNADVVVNNAGFYNLGRTDKSKAIDDVGSNINGTVGRGTNIRGRYPLHVHRTGTEDINGTSAKIIGNAIVGSPGWGIAQHESNAILDSNVIFDVFGAGIMSEAGTELGAWRNNIAIKTKDSTPGSVDAAEESRHLNYDLGTEGDGYWVQGSGAGIEITNNIAISNEGAGIDFHHERFPNPRNLAEPGAARFAVKNLTPELQSEFSQLGLTEVDIAVLPIRKFSGFETYNSHGGMLFYSVSRNEDGQGSFSNMWGVNLAFEGRSRVENFKLWNIYGLGLEEKYTGSIDFVDGLIAGNPNSPYRFFGVYGNSQAVNHLYKNIRIEDFPIGFRVPPDNDTFAPISTPLSSSRLENSFLFNDTNFDNFESRNWPGGGYRYPDYFQIVNTQFQSTGSNVVPTANFTAQGVGGLAQAFDASTSSDGVSGGSNRSIVSYGWDFNNDGQVDKFGRQVSYVFAQPGANTVTLKVWDNDGAVGTKTQTVNVASTAYPNLIVDGTFSSTEPFINKATKFIFGAVGGPDLYSNAAGNYGWTISPSWSGITSWARTNGTAVIRTSVSGTPGIYDGILGQVIGDDYTHRGQQQFNVSIKNTEGSDGVPNKLTLKVWGVNGEFAWDNSGPRQFGALPTPGITKLFDQTVGGTTFDWSNFNWNVDFGSGYQFVLVQVVPQNINLSRGDYLALDNFKIDAPAPVVNPPQDISYAVATSQGTLTEGNSGSQPVTFTVSRSGATANASTVNFAISGSATNGQDYSNIAGSSGATGLTGTVNFAANETSKTITLNVLGDTTVESDETVIVTLSNPTAPGSASLTTSLATTTITNDDVQSTLPNLAIADVSITEGDSGTKNVQFTVSLSSASSQPITVNYTTANGTADAGSDYTAASGTLTFNPGETSKTILVSVSGDALIEANETFFVNLSNVTNATLTNSQSIATITNDDVSSTLPKISISNRTVNETNSGTKIAKFTVYLSSVSTQSVTVNYATANDTAVAGSDYTATSGTLTFNPGETSKTIQVYVLGDTLIEANETFFVNLSDPLNATIFDSQGLGAIYNDD